MSSRSKEKVAAAIRKIFKNNNDKAVDVPVAGNVSNIAAAVGATNAVATISNNKNEHVSNGASESPGKRKRRQDNKISPAVTGINCGTNQQQQQHQQLQNVGATSIRARRLMKEFKEMQRIQYSQTKPIFTVELVNDNLFEWHARLQVVDPDSKLFKDMVELNIPCILLHLIFPENFPFAPPFMRVVEPRIEKGFVMEGGAICMELLTPRGWASAYTVEAVLMQFSASVVKGQGRIMRRSKGTKDFTRRSAEEAFRALVKTHEKYGWVTPALSDG